MPQLRAQAPCRFFPLPRRSSATHPAHPPLVDMKRRAKSGFPVKKKGRLPDLSTIVDRPVPRRPREVASREARQIASGEAIVIYEPGQLSGPIGRTGMRGSMGRARRPHSSAGRLRSRQAVVNARLMAERVRPAASQAIGRAIAPAGDNCAQPRLPHELAAGGPLKRSDPPPQDQRAHKARAKSHHDRRGIPASSSLRSPDAASRTARLTGSPIIIFRCGLARTCQAMILRRRLT